MTKLIHVAKVRFPSRGTSLLYLRQEENGMFCWYQINHEGKEEATAVTADNAEEAIRLARRQWKHEEFTTLHCGFKYTLPERDEHGTNALFCEMAASYQSPNGNFFDENAGGMAFVDFASKEALDLWHQLNGRSGDQ